MPNLGDTIYVFDETWRVYQQDEKGKTFGGPIWQEHWRKCLIIGENQRSFLTDLGYKILKKGVDQNSNIAIDDSDLRMKFFMNDQRARVVRRLQYLPLNETAKFMQIFNLLMIQGAK